MADFERVCGFVGDFVNFQFDEQLGVGSFKVVYVHHHNRFNYSIL